MNTQPYCRLVGPVDLDELRQMLYVFGEAFEDRETYAAAQPDDDYLRRLLSSETFIAIAAIDGCAVVGGLAGYILPKVERARSEFYIYDLAVKASHRRRGLATNLIEEIKSVAAQRDVYAIFVQADYGDVPAIALYTKLGVRQDVVHFDISPTGSAAQPFTQRGSNNGH